MGRGGGSISFMYAKDSVKAQLPLFVGGFSGVASDGYKWRKTDDCRANNWQLIPGIGTF